VQERQEGSTARSVDLAHRKIYKMRGKTRTRETGSAGTMSRPSKTKQVHLVVAYGRHNIAALRVRRESAPQARLG